MVLAPRVVVRFKRFIKSLRKALRNVTLLLHTPLHAEPEHRRVSREEAAHFVPDISAVSRGSRSPGNRRLTPVSSWPVAPREGCEDSWAWCFWAFLHGPFRQGQPEAKILNTVRQLCSVCLPWLPRQDQTSDCGHCSSASLPQGKGLSNDCAVLSAIYHPKEPGLLGK